MFGAGNDSRGDPPFVVSLLLVSVFAVGLVRSHLRCAKTGEDYSFGGLVSHGVLPYVALTVAMIPWLLLSMRAAVVEAGDLRCRPGRTLTRDRRLVTAARARRSCVGVADAGAAGHAAA